MLIYNTVGFQDTFYNLHKKKILKDQLYKLDKDPILQGAEQPKLLAQFRGNCGCSTLLSQVYKCPADGQRHTLNIYILLPM